MAQPEVHASPRVRLPRPGEMTLSLCVSREIGHGRVGRVYEANVNLAESSSLLQTMVLPPLVVKIARKDRSSALLPEAWNYEEMQDRKSTRLNSSHSGESRMPSSA